MSRKETEPIKIPDPEVVPVAQRRQFTAEEKLRILEEADACTEPGEIGALVRREGIYSSYLSRWRREREEGQLTAQSSKKRGPKTSAEKALLAEVAKLRRENEQLRTRLGQAEAIIEVQKKLSQLLGPSSETNGSNERR
jgi:transposase-like protein